MKTENPLNVGKHAFTVAGLGDAPFRYTGMSENVFKAGDTTKAGGSCDYCGTGIRYEFHIISADGKRSKVGCDCIAKVGDAGLMRAYKQSAEFRKMQRDKRQAKGASARETCNALVAAHRDALMAQPHPYGFTNRQTGAPLTMLDSVQWMLSNCGTSGITRYARTLADLCAKLAVSKRDDTLTPRVTSDEYYGEA